MIDSEVVFGEEIVEGVNNQNVFKTEKEKFLQNWVARSVFGWQTLEREFFIFFMLKFFFIYFLIPKKMLILLFFLSITPFIFYDLSSLIAFFFLSRMLSKALYDTCIP